MKIKRQQPSEKRNINKTINIPAKTEPTTYAVEMINITKTFFNGALKANDNLNLRVRTGEIHAIVGENGAGKSTAMSILFGTLKQDSGIVKVNGKIANFHSSRDATAAGIGMVHQHFKLVNVYTLLENIVLGAEKTKHGIIDMKKMHSIVKELAKKYNLSVNLNSKVKDAPIGEQQRTEILKLLYRNVQILIFDEPTAVLSDQEIAGFLNMLLEFKRQGKTIILITHKLNEVKKVADHATIIRHGKFVKEVDVKKTTTQDMADAMVGKKLVISVNKDTNLNYKNKPVICSIKNLNAFKIAQPKVLALNNFSLDIHEGEIIGLAGIEGNGQTELSLILGGLLKHNVTGEVTLFNNKTNKKTNVLKSNIKTLYKDGISHVPEDRLKYGIVKDETVAINSVLPEIDQYPFTKWGFLNNSAIFAHAKSIISKWNVMGAQGGYARANNLSGGNQQKLVLGRELTRPHLLSILAQPTRGLDLGAINNVHDQIMLDVKNSRASILISYELDEILSITTRIVVISNGKVVYDSPTIKTNRETIAKYLSNSAMGGA